MHENVHGLGDLPPGFDYPCWARALPRKRASLQGLKSTALQQSLQMITSSVCCKSSIQKAVVQGMQNEERRELTGPM
jgi:hypothetical protein